MAIVTESLAPNPIITNVVVGKVTTPANGKGIVLPKDKVTIDDVVRGGSGDTLFSVNKNDPAEIKNTIIGNGKYKILSLLGRGGMAAVYLARDDAENLYAIKVISPKFIGPENWNIVSERFDREAKIVLDLTEEGNPNIVQAIESGSENKPTLKYLVMEYIKGGTLQSNANLTLPQKLEILAGVCDALGDIYSGGKEIIHRDLKPANIFLTHHGKPKIGDFGIAFDKNDLNRLTQTGAILGTVDYLSPEQARGEKHLEPASDLCAIGIMLYEMTTGKNPFPGDTQLAKINKRTEQPTRPSMVIRDLNSNGAAGSIPQIHPKLEALIMKLLSLNPRDRIYGTSEDPGDDAREIAGKLREIKQRMESGNNFSPLAFPTAASTIAFVNP